ncbi:MAG: hypothetical protein AABW49_03225 [Nanoarchaeota archaeon]
MVNNYSKKFVRIISALTMCGAIGGATLRWHTEIERGRSIPLAFSEIHQIETAYQVGPITKFLGRLNDAYMKIVESSNVASHTDDYKSFHHAFQDGLRKRMSGREKKNKGYHYDLSDHLEDIPALADEVHELLNPWVTAVNRIKIVNQQLNASWSSKHDKTTSSDLECSTDIDGNISCTTTTECDYVDSYFYFDRNHGIRAQETLQDLLDKNLNIVPSEEIRTATVVQAENQAAIESTKDGGKKLTQNELLHTVNIWKTGSTYEQEKDGVIISWSNIPYHLEELSKANTTATQIHHNRSHACINWSGPEEYKTFQSTLANGTDLATSIENVLRGIDVARTTLPELRVEIDKYTNLDPESKEADKSYDKIMSLARLAYESNFRGGHDTHKFRWHRVAIDGLVGGLFAGLIGFGARKILKHNR